MFILSKIIGTLISPLNLIFILLVGGGIVYWVFERIGRVMIVAGILLLAVLGGAPTGTGILSWMEMCYARPDKLPDHIDGIMVLGGAFDTELSAAHQSEAANDNIERVAEGVRLAREHPEAQLLFSGGEGRLKKSGTTEGVVTEKFLRRMGLDDRNILFEDESRNTKENIVFSKKLIKPKDQEIWIIVTSAYHMPRTMMIFGRYGWGRAIPWPADYRTDGRLHIVPDRFDVNGNLKAAELALHEGVGMLAFLAGEQWMQWRK